MNNETLKFVPPKIPSVDRDTMHNFMHTYIPLEKKRISALVTRFKEPLLKGDISLLEPFPLEEAIALFGLDFFAARGQAVLVDKNKGLSWYVSNALMEGTSVERVECQQQTPPRTLMKIIRRGIIDVGGRELAQETSIRIDDPERGKFKAHIAVTPEVIEVAARLTGFLLISGEYMTRAVKGCLTHEGKNAIPPYRRIPLSR